MPAEIARFGGNDTGHTFLHDVQVGSAGNLRQRDGRLHFAREIRGLLKSEEEGWGRLKAKAQIGDSEWDTAIWFDTKMNTYLLPLKAGIRKKENIEAGRKLEIAVWI